MKNLQAEEALTIVREILSFRLDPKKITCKHLKGYIAIMIEDDSYRTICRLYLNNQRRKYLGTISRKKVESRERIDHMTDIFKYSDDLLATILVYESAA